MSDSQPVQMQIRLKASAATVYRALTAAEALTAWLSESASVDLPGGRFILWGKHTPHCPAQQDSHMRLLDHQADRRLSFAWDMGDRSTRVIFRLRQDDGATILTLIHHRSEHGQAESFSLEDYWFLHLENLRRFLDGRSSEARVDFSRPMSGDIQHTLQTTANAERVWAVLTEPRMMERWIANSAGVELRAGGKYDLGWGIEGIKVIEFDISSHLTISWMETDESLTRVTFSLDARDGSTHITLHHSGFQPDYPNNGIWVGWLNYLNWLRSVAEYGEGWQPPVIALADNPWAQIYPKSMHEAQASLIKSDFDLESEI